MHKRVKKLYLAVGALMILPICSCATYRAEFPKQWTPIEQVPQGHCPDLSGKYPNIPEFLSNSKSYGTHYDPFRLNWVIVSDLTESQRERIKDVVISMNQRSIEFNFVDVSGETVSKITYPRGSSYNSFTCTDSLLIIYRVQGMYADPLGVNSRRYEMSFSKGADNSVLLKLVVIDRGVGLLVIPYRTHNEYVYRFTRIK